MNNLGLQQSAAGSFCDEKRGLVSTSGLKGPVICPKPRHLGALVNDPIRPLRLHMSHQVCVPDSNYGTELLDIIFKKEGHGTENTSIEAASPPLFFYGSPPTRAGNPLIRDARFGDEKLTPMAELSSPSCAGISSPTTISRKGGCVRMKFGLKPAAVRVEGFNCANMNHQNSGITAMA